MPERVPLRLDWDPEMIRAEVIDNAANVEPLLPVARGCGRQRCRFSEQGRRSPGAGHTHRDEPRCGRCNRVGRDRHGFELDRLALGGSSIAQLFVPEVSNPTRFELTLDANGERERAPIVVPPQRKWSIHLVHHSHFDYGYTDQQPRVMDNHLRFLDAAVDLVDATGDWPEEAQFRWNIEVHYPLQKWMAQRPASMRSELIRQVNDGRMEIAALPFSMHTEAYSIDELAWGLKYAQQLRDEHGIEIVSAFQSDVPGAVIGLLTLLTEADIRYFTVAHNYAGRSIPFRVGGQELTRPFWWRRAGGKRLLVWHTDTPHGMAYMDGNLVGLADGETAARAALPDYLAALASQPYPYGGASFGWKGLPDGLPVTKQPYPHDILHFRIQSSIADNAPPSLKISETVRDWNATWAWPKVRLSRNRDFFEIAEREIGPSLDEFAGDWTDWWADGIGSGAHALSINRKAQADIRAAQSIHTAADLVTGDRDFPASGVDAAYEDMSLFDEHTWGAADPWMTGLEHVESGDLQWHRKADFAHEASEATAKLLDAGLHRLAAHYSPANDALASLLVFNQVGFERDAMTRVFLPAERVAMDAAFRLIDPSTGAELPYVLDAQPFPRFRATGRWLVFTAPNLPSLGYARFDLVAGEPAGAVAQAGSASTLESPFYTVTIDPSAGFITSIVDKESGRELVDASAAHGFNEYIYDRYTSAPEFNHLSGRIEALDLSLLGERTVGRYAAVVARESNAVFDRITLRMVGTGAEWLETTITLPQQTGQVLIENRLMKLGVTEKESIYFAFPFAVDDPDPEYAITGGVTSLDAPHVPGSVQHMLAIRDWVGLQDSQGSAAWATVDAPLIELQNIAVPYAPFPNTIPGAHHRRATIYSWALNNIWDTNFPPQQRGELVFRYVVGSSRTLGRRALGIRTAAATVSAPVGICLRASAGPELPARTSLVSVSDPLVEIVHLEAGSEPGTVRARLLSLAPEPVSVALSGSAGQATKVGTFLGARMEPIPSAGVTLQPGDYVAVELMAE
ncbi:MAG: hypothetical protein M9947_10345 [Thermomicrobiales bacterium]|nr:hypothetical protein [Thermomicrobiales bacterium]